MRLEIVGIQASRSETKHDTLVRLQTPYADQQANKWLKVNSFNITIPYEEAKNLKLGMFYNLGLEGN